MDIIKIERMRKRCCRKVESTGTGHYDGDKHRCAKPALYQIDGLNYCSLHAGQVAVHHLIENPDGS